MRVLMVDDETEFLELMNKRLSRRGIDAVTASSGQEALDLVDKALAGDPEEMFKVVVMDVRMPGMDGLETLRRMKAKAPELPVVLLTGHAATGVAVEGMDLGAYDYMLKPVSINELIVKMEEAMRCSDTAL
ncbi:MAG: response regulator [Desulfovibrio sp.]|nr:response regulator [Desulfovibrio sp.]